MTADQPTNLARRLNEGLNGDADQRAAIQLLGTAARGVWLRKLDGWPAYIRALDDPRRPCALWIDWDRLREDLAADDRARATFNDWASSYAGRRATEDEHESRLAATVPLRPWHGASSSELVLLSIALELAPGGLLGDGIPRLDAENAAAVLRTISQLFEDRVSRAGLTPADLWDTREERPLSQSSARPGNLAVSEVEGD